jgi:hypothetical protein
MADEKKHLCHSGRIACGRHNQRGVSDPGEVTCEACLKTKHFADYSEGWYQAVTYMFNKVVGPAIDEMKRVTEWRDG